VTDVREILGGNSSPAEDVSAEVPVPSAAPATDEETASRPVVSSEVPNPHGVKYPERIVSSEVDAGYLIEYYSGSDDPGEKPEPRWYKIDGVEVPSVTTVLDILHKPALTWWGMKVGIAGVTEVYDRWVAACRSKEHDGHTYFEDFSDEWYMHGPDEWAKLLTAHKLTVNHVRDKAARRGTSVHAALEAWAVTGNLAHPDDFPEEEQGYVKGLNAFLADCKGHLFPKESELMVGSKDHGFAGRFDLQAYMAPSTEEDGFTLQTGPRTKRFIPSGRGIFDLKTSKGVYDSHYLQLSAYRLALEESGYGRSDFEAVILVNADGRYDVKLNPKRPDHFLSVLQTWRALR